MIELNAKLHPNWVSPPGETIVDLIEEKGWTQAEFANRIGYTSKHISLLVNGKAPITEETALRLERVLGSTARFWLNREALYREALAREAENETLKRDIAWLKELPIRDMLRWGWINRTRDGSESVAECLRFFGLASVELWRKSRYRNPIVAFRASHKYQKHAGAIGAWLRQGEREAEKMAIAPFDKALFKQTLPRLRSLTLERNPGVFLPILQTICGKSGVAVVTAPTPRGCPVSGATQFLNPEKALLMLSFRYQTNDHFWFSFFHEAAHLILHGKRMQFLELDGGLNGEEEQEADIYARDLLIPPAMAARLASVPHTKQAISEFAFAAGVAPGIVVGRMQKDGLLAWTHLNGLKTRFRIP